MKRTSPGEAEAPVRALGIALGLATALALALPALGTDPPPLPSFTVTVDRSAPALGESVSATYSAELEEGASIELAALVSPALEPKAMPPDGPAIEFAAPGPERKERSRTAGRDLWSRSFPFAPLAAGTYDLPGPRLVYVSPSGQRFAVRPPAVTLTVSSRLPPGQQKDQVAPKALRPPRIPPLPWWVWALLAATVAAVAGLVARLLLRRRPGGAATEAEAPPVPPGEEFLAAVDRLSARLPADGDDPRPFFSDLAHATKRYLERRVDRPVLEWTTLETLRRLREAGVDLPREAGLAELLGAADRVKFARALSTREEAAKELARARGVHDRVEKVLSPAAPAAVGTASAGGAV